MISHDTISSDLIEIQAPREFVWDTRLANSTTPDYAWDGRLANSTTSDLALTR